MSSKYPRTFHLPFSPGATKDDRKLSNVNHLLGRQLIITEKMDGSNVCLESKNVFARSHSKQPDHPSFNYLKTIHQTIRNNIPDNIQVFGEWLYAQHSIHYTSLHSYLNVFGVREIESNTWASWPVIQSITTDLALQTVPVLLDVKFDTAKQLQETIETLSRQPSVCGGEREGVVVRVVDEFKDDDFNISVAKFVRANHVQTDDHWSSKTIIKNILKK
jgi:hypothetical protein